MMVLIASSVRRKCYAISLILGCLGCCASSLVGVHAQSLEYPLPLAEAPTTTETEAVLAESAHEPYLVSVEVALGEGDSFMILGIREGQTVAQVRMFVLAANCVAPAQDDCI